MSYIGMKLPLKEGESYCTNCDGTGRVVSGDRCQKCDGFGKLDWVEAVVGKKKPPSSGLVLGGGWKIGESEDLTEVFNGTSWTAKEDFSMNELARKSPTLKELLNSKKNKI